MCPRGRLCGALQEEEEEEEEAAVLTSPRLRVSTEGVGAGWDQQEWTGTGQTVLVKCTPVDSNSHVPFDRTKMSNTVLTVLPSLYLTCTSCNIRVSALHPGKRLALVLPASSVAPPFSLQISAAIGI